jgi:hypothetical protein
MSEAVENIWDKTFLELGQTYRHQFLNSEDTEGFLKLLGRGFIITGCFNIIYGILLKQGDITAIEELEIKEKEALFEEAKRISDNKSKEHIVKVCKAIHTLGTLLQQ